jgi:DNA-binding response OmpR family regulator
MKQSTRSPHLILVGVLEVGPRSEELRKGGLKIKLQQEPFQTLAMLFMHPSEVVTWQVVTHKLTGLRPFLRIR